MNVPQQRRNRQSPKPLKSSSLDFGEQDLFLLGPARQWRSGSANSIWKAVCVLSSDADVIKAFQGSVKDSVWLANSVSRLAVLAKDAVPPTGERRIVIFESIPEVHRRVLSIWFRHVLATDAGISLLKPQELAEVLQSPDRHDLFIGGAYDPTYEIVLLYRGSVEPLVVPLSWFQQASGTRVDPRRLSFTDFGQTVKLGHYEASTDAILYEMDGEYRKRARKRLVEDDPSLGGAIRRLRLQKGLSQSDFPVPIRTIARIERGEVARPHAATLEKIARRLRVPPEDLASY